MKYRDAKHLKQGDQVKTIVTGTLIIVSDIEVLGSINIVRINCIDPNGKKIILYNAEVQ